MVAAAGSPGMQTTTPASSPGTGAAARGQQPWGQAFLMGLGLLGAMRKLWREQLPVNHSSSAGSQHPAL